MDFGLGFFGRHAALSDWPQCGSARQVKDGVRPGAEYFPIKLKLFKTHLQKRQLTHFPSLLKASGHAAEVVNVSTVRCNTA